MTDAQDEAEGGYFDANESPCSQGDHTPVSQQQQQQSETMDEPHEGKVGSGAASAAVIAEELPARSGVMSGMRFVYCMLLLFCGGAPLFGWPALLLLIKSSGLSVAECRECEAETLKFNQLYLMGFIGTQCAGIFLGLFLDRFGAAKTVMLAELVMALGAVLLGCLSDSSSIAPLWAGVLFISVPSGGVIAAACSVGPLFAMPWLAMSVFNGCR